MKKKQQPPQYPNDKSEKRKQWLTNRILRAIRKEVRGMSGLSMTDALSVLRLFNLHMVLLKKHAQRKQQ